MKKKIRDIIIVAVSYIMLCNYTVLAEDMSEEELKDKIVQAFSEANIGLQEDLCKIDLSNTIDTEQEISVFIDENERWEANRELMGVQYEWTDNYSTFYGSDGELNNEYKELLKRSGPIPVIRLGGTSSNHTNLVKSAIGPYSKRTGTPSIQDPTWGSFYGSSSYKMGLPEMIKMGYANNPDMKFIICVSTILCTPEDISNLVHYMKDKADESQWGKMRADDGIEEPVNVWYWELGNEVDRYTEEGQEAYIQTAKEFINAIKEVDSDAKICVCGPTAPWGRYWDKEEGQIDHWSSWHRRIMPELAEYVDAISFHPYYDGYSSEFMMYFQDTIKKDIDSIVEEKQIKDSDGKMKDIKILSTESARYVDSSTQMPLNLNFESAVSTSHFWNLCSQRPWCTGSMYHNIIGGGWCAFWRVVDGEFLKTPTAKIQELYYENIGEKIVSSDWSGEGKNDEDEGNSENDFSVMTTQMNEHEINVFLTNKTAYRKLKINFESNYNYTLVEETVFNAPNSITFPVNRECENLVTVTKTEKNEQNFNYYEMNGEGVVVLKLRTNSVIGGSIENDVNENKAPNAEAAFPDTGNCYANNEIAALKNAEMISGSLDGNFYPNNNITVAEFSAILVKIMGWNTGYTGTLWADVPENEWYSKYANAMYVEDVLSGTLYNANRNITVEELLRLVSKVYLKTKKNSDFAEYISNNSLYIFYAASEGFASELINNQELELSRYATRADAAAILYKLYIKIN